MNTPRETLYAALFAKLAASAGYITSSRNLRHWTDVAPEEMPAIFQSQTEEIRRQIKGQGVTWELHVKVYVYVHTNQQQLGGAVVASTLLNPLLDAVEAALAPDDVSNNVQTLGGLVSHCWIDGPILTSEGMLGDHEVAVIPVSMLVPT